MNRHSIAALYISGTVAMFRKHGKQGSIEVFHHLDWKAKKSLQRQAFQPGYDDYSLVPSSRRQALFIIGSLLGMECRGGESRLSMISWQQHLLRANPCPEEVAEIEELCFITLPLFVVPLPLSQLLQQWWEFPQSKPTLPACFTASKWLVEWAGEDGASLGLEWGNSYHTLNSLRTLCRWPRSGGNQLLEQSQKLPRLFKWLWQQRPCRLG